MRIILFILGALLIAVVLYWGITFYLTVQVSKKIIGSTEPYKKVGTDERAVLVLGDSTAVGIGAASPEESVAGRVSKYLDATAVENYARSGARTKELPAQSVKAEFSQYRLILIQTGGNDIIRFQSAESAAEELRAAIAALPPAERVVIISAGDVGGATLFPFPVRPFHTKLNKEYHDAFARVAEETGVTYVNFGNAPATEEINKRPDIYLAKDGLHPSSEGYRLWFETIRPSL
ncbi:MAG TPA: GDSL-type esterase/lipase family protein [Candidatus Paceibacterota bacterium]|nr:GDSL-type esterase/lipase family protein [Candidatus Paceibacterota bacterium]